MQHRKAILAAAAAFALGVAFAAQPTSDHSERSSGGLQQRAPWTPGKNMLMPDPGSSIGPLAPPR